MKEQILRFHDWYETNKDALDDNILLSRVNIAWFLMVWFFTYFVPGFRNDMMHLHEISQHAFLRGAYIVGIILSIPWLLVIWMAFAPILIRAALLTAQWFRREPTVREQLLVWYDHYLKKYTKAQRKRRFVFSLLFFLVVWGGFFYGLSEEAYTFFPFVEGIVSGYAEEDYLLSVSGAVLMLSLFYFMFRFPFFLACLLLARKIGEQENRATQ